MSVLIQELRAFLAYEQGATAVEYGLFLAAIAGVIAAILFSLGGTVNSGIANFNTEYQNQLTANSGG